MMDADEDGPRTHPGPGAGLRLADAHADSLMWNRPLEETGHGGHVDFPRLTQAGVALQCFTVVTGGFPYVGGFSQFARWRGWPAEARRDPWSRYRFQVEGLRRACDASGGRVRRTTTRSELEAHLAEGAVSAVLGVEGGQLLVGHPERLETLVADGVRFLSLTHLRNNGLGGASFPALRRPGLSPEGQELVEAMGAHGVAVDLAHASRRMLAEVTAHRDVPLMCSHTGVCGATDHFRNLTDPVLKAIAERGGVVGIILAPVYLGGRDLSAVARHIEHAIDIMGEEGVGIGSDFDGMVALPRGIRDVRDLPRVAEALVARGHSTQRVERVMGGNWIRFFHERLGRFEVSRRS